VAESVSDSLWNIIRVICQLERVDDDEHVVHTDSQKNKRKDGMYRPRKIEQGESMDAQKQERNRQADNTEMTKMGSHP
jgi:hypothetical protein